MYNGRGAFVGRARTLTPPALAEKTTPLPPLFTQLLRLAYIRRMVKFTLFGA